MCLQSAKLSMKFSPEYDTYIGIGYKSSLTVQKVGEWVEAKGWKRRKPETLKRIGLQEEYDYYGKEYLAGFHIFLDQCDAVNFNPYNDIYEVEFSDVIAFGTQYTHAGVYKDCVVTRWIKYNKIVQIARVDNW